MALEALKQVGERVGAMSLRERLFVFAAALLGMLAVVQLVLIDPANQRAQQARDRMLAADDGLAELERQQGPQSAGPTPDQTLREQVTALEARLAALDADVEARERTLVPPERMHQVLREMVRGQGSLRIVDFRSLPPKPVGLSDAPDAPPGYYRHGVEITVSGRYDELVAYLERLEALPWRLDWSEAKLDASNRPDLALTLTVHTLSLEEAWLRV